MNACLKVSHKGASRGALGERRAHTRHTLVCSQRVEVVVGNKDKVSAQRLLQDDARLLDILREKLEQLSAGALQQYVSRTSPQDERELQQVKFQYQGLLSGSLQVEAQRRGEGGQWGGHEGGMERPRARRKGVR
eukprot:5281883-Pleurochrysis_carterae.AAC.1